MPLAMRRSNQSINPRIEPARVTRNVCGVAPLKMGRVPLTKDPNKIASGYSAFAFSYALILVGALLAPVLLAGAPLGVGLVAAISDSYGLLLVLFALVLLHATLAVAVRRIFGLGLRVQTVTIGVVSGLAATAVAITGQALWRWHQGVLELPLVIFAALFAFCYCWLAAGVAKMKMSSN